MFVFSVQLGLQQLSIFLVMMYIILKTLQPQKKKLMWNTKTLPHRWRIEEEVQTIIQNVGWFPRTVTQVMTSHVPYVMFLSRKVACPSESVCQSVFIANAVLYLKFWWPLSSLLKEFQSLERGVFCKHLSNDPNEIIEENSMPKKSQIVPLFLSMSYTDSSWTNWESKAWTVFLAWKWVYKYVSCHII